MEFLVLEEEKAVVMSDCEGCYVFTCLGKYVVEGKPGGN